MSGKVIGIGLLVAVGIALVSIYIYTAFSSTADWSWQLTFFVLITTLLTAAASGFIGFKVGQGLH